MPPKSLLWVTAGMLLVALATITVIMTYTEIDSLMNYDKPRDPFFTLKNNPAFAVEEMGTGPNNLAPDGNAPKPLIALYRKNLSGEWSFHCSAVVMTNAYALTAGHCLVDDSGELTRDDIQVREDDLNEDKSFIVKAASINPRADLGIVLGDFKKFNHGMMARRGFMNRSGPFVTCGFVYGESNPICTQFVPIDNFIFAIRGRGYLYPGMSGGPVFDTSTNEIVGLNSGAYDGFVTVVPTIGLLGALDLKLEN